MLLPDGRVEPVELQVLFHPQYPFRPPFVSEVGGRWTPDDDRHIPQDRNFCLYLRDADEPDLRDPIALRRFMLDVICFLDQQLIYERVGRFPGPQWPHRENAYALHVIERLGRVVPFAAQGIWEAARATQLSRNAPCPSVAEHPCDRIGLLLRHATSVARRRRQLNSICVVERIERIVALLASMRGCRRQDDGRSRCRSAGSAARGLDADECVAVRRRAARTHGSATARPGGAPRGAGDEHALRGGGDAHRVRRAARYAARRPRALTRG
jgi:hypothetical protein